jgi:uncharacterized protein YndB with AHSA1/START domain
MSMLNDISIGDARIELPADTQVLLSRLFDAPRALVFKAWSDPDHVAQWWGPKGFVNTACSMDFRVGGRFRLDMRGPDGVTYPCEGIYQEIVEPERIVYLGIADEQNACGAGLPPEARVTVDFAEHQGKTMLSIRATMKSSAAREAALAMGFGQGWSQSLERLAERLASLV